MKGNLLVRIVILAVAWAALCFLLISERGFNGPTILVMAISGGIIFVPVYKKYGNGKA